MLRVEIKGCKVYPSLGFLWVKHIGSCRGNREGPPSDLQQINSFPVPSRSETKLGCCSVMRDQVAPLPLIPPPLKFICINNRDILFSQYQKKIAGDGPQILLRLFVRGSVIAVQR